MLIFIQSPQDQSSASKCSQECSSRLVLSANKGKSKLDLSNKLCGLSKMTYNNPPLLFSISVISVSIDVSILRLGIEWIRADPKAS